MENTDGGKGTWTPYQTVKDCSRGSCVYCPQLCFRPPPTPPSVFDFTGESSSSATFSPLVIAIIGILASAVLLVGYYFIVTRNCGGFEYLNRRREISRGTVYLGDDDHEFGGGGGGRTHSNEAWHVAMTDGLEESVIKSIAVCKYKKSDGFVDGTDCPVCLAEFNEDESLRLLPRCSHAFHINCIDTWLKSHSNCPLCRAIVISPITPATYFTTQSHSLPPHPPADEIRPPTPQVSNEPSPISIQDLGRRGGDERKVQEADERVAGEGSSSSSQTVGGDGPGQKDVKEKERSNNNYQIPIKRSLSGRSLYIEKKGSNGNSTAVLPIPRHYSDEDSDSDSHSVNGAEYQ